MGSIPTIVWATAMSIQPAFRACLLLVALTLMAPVVGACDASEYHTFSFTHTTGTDSSYSVRETVGFSFAYPSGYRKVMTYAKSNRAAPVAVRFARATGSFGRVRQTDTVFAVNIQWPGPEWRDAKEAIDRAISALDSLELVRERSAATVAGIPAEQVAYHDPRMPVTPEAREVFFDHDGRIWNILIYSETSGADQAKLDFDHITQTFKILP